MPRHDPGLQRLNLGGIFLLLLISTDVAFILVHLLREIPLSMFARRLYSLETDRGYAEIFQYVKTYWVVILLGALAWRTRAYVYAGWALLFAYMLCDDALMIHERGGGAIASRWGFESRFGLRPQDFGELTVAGAFGLAFLVLIAALLLAQQPRRERRIEGSGSPARSGSVLRSRRRHASHHCRGRGQHGFRSR